MPTYEHKCNNTECGEEFEDFYSIAAALPPCPKCGSDVMRLISGGAGRGIVELTGAELKQSLQEAGIKLRNKAARDEKTMGNLVGESKYQINQTYRDKLRRG